MTISTRWWDAPKGEVHSILGRVVTRIRETQSWRRQAAEYHAGLYAGGSGAAALELQTASEYIEATLPDNIVREAVDTVLAERIVDQTLPQILTTKGDDALQRKGRKMAQFLEGCFHQQEVYEEHWEPFLRDALVYGDGYIRVYVNDDDEICTEVLDHVEVHVDEWDAKSGKPACIYVVRSYDRAHAAALWPKFREAIESAGRVGRASEWEAWRPVTTEPDALVADRIYVAEAWRLGPRKGVDGRHVMCIEGADIVDEKYTWPMHQVLKLSYSKAMSGWHGVGLAERLEGYQYQINELATRIEESDHMLGSAFIFEYNGSGIADGGMTNGLRRIKVSSPALKPEVYTPQPVHPDVYGRSLGYRERALQSEGISTLTAHGQTPKDIESGIAIQTVSDIETTRRALFAINCRTAARRLGELYILCARDLSKRNPDFMVSAPGKNDLQPVKWADVDMAQGAYSIKVVPTRGLSKDFGRRLDQVIKLRAEGAAFNDRATFLKLIGMPDLEQALDEETSPQAVVDAQLGVILEADDPIAAAAENMPEAFCDLIHATDKALRLRCLKKINGAGEETLQALQDYWENARRARQRLPPNHPAWLPPDVPEGGLPAPAAGAPPGVPPPAGAPPPMPGELPPPDAPPPGMPPMTDLPPEIA